jgi:hypothetical protein
MVQRTVAKSSGPKQSDQLENRRKFALHNETNVAQETKKRCRKAIAVEKRGDRQMSTVLEAKIFI